MVLGHNFHRGSRTQDVKIAQDVTFETMLLSEPTLSGLKNSGFYKPSPIQLQGIPLGKCGFDLLLEAKSGTGKTAVFTVVALEKINLKNGLQVVILAPTREIAAQICDVIKQIGRGYAGLTVEVVMGGLPVKEDIEKLKKNIHIIVGSPGRLLHLIRDNHIETSAVRLLVLDEADKLMEKSFRKDIEHILSFLPLQKQIIFSSATFPDESKAFINKYVQVSQHICPDNNSVLLGISQKVTVVKYNTNIVRQTQHRFEELLNILSKKEFKQCLIFCNYQARVADLYKMLNKAKWPAEKLYGQQEQLDRLEALKTLQEYKCRILIATDLAARGLDSSHVDFVINFEPPYEWQTYLHRIGRAGRFGAYGTAVTILNQQEEEKFKELLNSIHFQLDIRKFWSDEAFQYKEKDFNLPVTLEHTMSILNSDDEIDEFTNEQNFRDVWDSLICETTYNNKSVETFDTLCTSFMKTNDKIKSFTDLLDSFRNYNNVDSDVTSKYQCYKQTLSLTKYKQHKKHNSLTDSPGTREYEIETTTTQDNLMSDCETKRKIYENGFNQDGITPNDTCKKEKDKYHSKNYRSTRNSNKRNENTQRKSDYKNNSSSKESDDNGYNTASYDYKKSQSSSAKNERCNTQNHHCDSHKQKRHSEYVYGYTDNYIDWYRYLKFRTQQIQMAVYINELSKL